MPRKIPVIFIVILCFAFVSRAQEIKGIWAGAFEADDVFAAVRINFDESKIVLSYADDERPGTIQNVKISDGEISFTGDIKPQVRFTGKLDGERLGGTFDILRGDGTKSSSGVWSLRKVDSWNFVDDAKTVSSNEKIELSKPSGKFAIGRKFFYWTDESRLETITDEPNDKRKLFVQIWYPAKNGGKTAAEYFPNLEEIHGKSENNDLSRSLKTHAVQDAKIAVSKTKFPVIIFSPGLGTSPFRYTAIIENLVSRGYVVAAINHPFDSGDFKFSDNQIIRYASEKWDREISKDWTAEQRKQFFDERRIGWARDISFVVDKLENLDDSFKKHLDLQNLGMLGHSFGGQAATIACASDARFKACANLDGMAQGNVFLPDASGKILRQPFLFFTKSAEVTNSELKIMNLKRDEYRAKERKRLTTRWKPSYKNRLAELESGAYYVLYPGIKHSSFSDSLLLETNPNDQLFAEKDATAQNINDYILAFFDKFLMKKSATLIDNNEPRPPVILEFLKRN